MIKRLRIKNFQSHKDTELEFHPGINVICGKSNSGKSSILRALKLLCENRPLGLHYKSHFAKPSDNVEVELETFDNHLIKIMKIKDKTVYILDGKEFVGSEVPDEIKSLLNISDINWQHQLEKHFLISESASEAARIINKIIRIEDVDEWVSELTSEINSENKHIRILEEQKEQLETAQNKYQHLQEAKKKLEEIDILYNNLYNVEIEEGILEKGIAELEKSDIKNLVFISNQIDTLLTKLEGIQKEEDLLNQFILIGDLEKYNLTQQKTEEIFELYNYSIDDYSKLEKRIIDLEIIENKIIDCHVLEMQFKNNIVALIGEIGECPWCGAVLNIGDEVELERFIYEICSFE